VRNAHLFTHTTRGSTILAFDSRIRTIRCHTTTVMTGFRCAFALTVFAAVLTACSESKPPKYSGPLISSKTSMATAWEFPKNPLNDPTLDDSRLSKDIKWGFKIFTNTPAEAPQFAPGKMSCNNCHLNGGQRERSLPLVGVAGAFPEYNRRSGRLYSLTDRVVDCFLRSENATSAVEPVLPTSTSKEVLALSAYLTSPKDTRSARVRAGAGRIRSRRRS
jgi:cytochrome c